MAGDGGMSVSELVEELEDYNPHAMVKVRIKRRDGKYIKKADLVKVVEDDFGDDVIIHCEE